jgi:tetratricopeptide (TPR) repeat protein
MRVRSHARWCCKLGALACLVALSSCRAATSSDSVQPETAPAPPTRLPSSARVTSELARELVRNLEGEAALRTYTQLLTANSRDARSGLALAQTAIEFGLHESGDAALRQVLEGEKVHAIGARLGLSLLALARYETSADPADFKTSEDQLRNVLAVEPDNPHALAQAVLLYLLRAEKEPGRHTPLARTICQEHEGTHASLAASCAEEARRRGDPRGARSLFVQATKADPEHHGAWLRLGVLELEAGNLRSARQYAEQATRSPWPSIRLPAHTTLGVALDRLGDTPGAIASYTAAWELCVGMDRAVPPDLLYNLGLAASRIADDEGELDRAQAILEQWLAIADTPHAQQLRVQQALAELASIRAEHQRTQR